MPKKQVALMREHGMIPVSQVARIIGVHVSTVYRWIDTQWIKAERLNNHWYIDAEHLADRYTHLPIIEKELIAALEG